MYMALDLFSWCQNSYRCVKTLSYQGLHVLHVISPPPVTTSVLPGDLRLATGPPESPKQVEQPAVTRLTASSLPEPQKQVQLPAVTTPRTATKTVLSPGGDYFLGTLSAIFSQEFLQVYLMIFFTEIPQRSIFRSKRQMSSLGVALSSTF